MNYRVCIVTPGYLSSTPRVVREADALTEAGLDVRVVFTQGQLEHLRAFDDDLADGASWTAAAFKWSNRRRGERWAYHTSRLRHGLVRALPSATAGLPRVAEYGEGRVYPELASLAAAEPAQLYIGHYPVGLAAAAHAARRRGALLAYDVEDLYAEAFADQHEWVKPRARITRLERRYVKACSHISAASQPMAEAFSVRYPGTQSSVVHNCHPWSARARLDGQVRDRGGSALSLFWFSQTIGPGRGVEQAIRAAGAAGVPVQLHLRGAIEADLRAEYQRLARESGLADGLVIHPACPPGELLSRATEHDVGLALEQGGSLNNRLAASNKLFLYLTAGLAVVATETAGQRSVMDTCSAAGRLVPCGDVEQIAKQIRAWASRPAELHAAKRAALAAAETRWNWEREGSNLATTLGGLLDERIHSRADKTDPCDALS